MFKVGDKVRINPNIEEFCYIFDEIHLKHNLFGIIKKIHNNGALGVIWQFPISVEIPYDEGSMLNYPKEGHGLINAKTNCQCKTTIPSIHLDWCPFLFGNE